MAIQGLNKMAGKNTSVQKSIGIVQTLYYTFDGFRLENGEFLGPITVAYETYGLLNKEKSNAILILHALSGDAHAAGRHKGSKDPGWWDSMIGPGKALDTNKYFIICSNILGGCKGTTGPLSENPATGRPYALDFPLITIGDMVACQKHLIDFLGIDRLLTVVGGSMGGMQVLTWLIKHSNSVQSAIPIATAARHSPQQIAFNEVGRQAVMADPQWNSGNYYGNTIPSRGLAVARMLGHITYMSDKSMAEKFGRQKKIRKDDQLFKFTADFEVEGYLNYRGDNFVKRFDSNSYLYITKAMDNYDASDGKPLEKVLEGIKAKIMVIAFKSDWLYPAYQSKEIVRASNLSGIETTYCEIESSYGHDAFLLEIKEETHLFKHFLNKIFNGYEIADSYEN